MYSAIARHSQYGAVSDSSRSGSLDDAAEQIAAPATAGVALRSIVSVILFLLVALDARRRRQWGELGRSASLRLEFLFSARRQTKKRPLEFFIFWRRQAVHEAVDCLETIVSGYQHAFLADWFFGR